MTLFNIYIGLDLVCAVISMLGSHLVSGYDRWSYVGWICWIVANVAWIVWGFSPQSGPVVGVILMNAFFLATSVRGLRTCRSAMRVAPGPAADA